MNASKILFATDFSEYSDAARKFATSLARDSGAMLLIVHAIEPAPHYADRGFAGYVGEEENEAAARKQLSETVPTSAEVGFSQTLLTGPPAKEITKFAEAENADLIVIGSHGRTGLARMLLGSVAEEIVRKAKCPVLTIKQPSNETADATG